MSKPHYSPLIAAGPLVFISGQLAFDATGRIVGQDIEAQAQRSLENLQAVLHGTGLDLTDVVKTTVWLRRTADFTAFNGVYAAFFGTHRPARSTVTSDLVLPEALIEIEAVAYRSGRA